MELNTLTGDIDIPEATEEENLNILAVDLSEHEYRRAQNDYECKVMISALTFTGMVSI